MTFQQDTYTMNIYTEMNIIIWQIYFVIMFIKDVISNIKSYDEDRNNIKLKQNI